MSLLQLAGANPGVIAAFFDLCIVGYGAYYWRRATRAAREATRSVAKHTAHAMIRHIEMPWTYEGRLSLLASYRSMSVKEKEKATKNAEILAHRILGDDVWAFYKRNGYIDVPSGTTKFTVYRIRPHGIMEVISVYKGGTEERTREFRCFYPTYTMPAVEFMVQTYLRMQSQEKETLHAAFPQSRMLGISNVF